MRNINTKRAKGNKLRKRIGINRKSIIETGEQSGVQFWIGVFTLTLATFLFLSLFSYSPLDECLNVANGEPVSNVCGKYGAIIADLILQSFGVSGWLMAAVLCSWSITLLAKGQINIAQKSIWAVISTVSLSAFAGFFSEYNFSMEMLPGGYVGYYLANLLKSSIGKIVGVILSLLVSSLSFYIAIRANKGLFSLAKKIHQQEKLKRNIKRLFKGIKYLLTLGPLRLIVGLIKDWGALKTFLSAFIGGTGRRKAKTATNTVETAVNKVKVLSNQTAEEGKLLGTTADEYATRRVVNFVAGAHIAAEDDTYIPPSIDILLQHKQTEDSTGNIDYEKRKQKLLQALKDFGVNGSISSYHVGPVVTLYELELEPGTKSGRVIGLANDIARAMQVPVIRIADIPSRGIMGIEVPNNSPQSIGLKSILTSPEYKNTRHSIPIVLGQDIMGKPIIDDLARMPHLLVAGTTGSGKSVGLNGMIVSMLYKMSPMNCRLIMIDPKMLELSLYNGIPHLLTPAITDPSQAILAMRWVVQEMQKRNKRMASLSVRNISGYNQKIVTAKMRGAKIVHKVEVGYDPITRRPIVEEAEEEPETMPYIVVIIDEMADLMMVAGKEMEGLIQRIAQMARAAGIHLIMATQRPSVDVITGVIKANLSTRISYKVASKIDSGIIVGEPGAEQLLGNGDMLYLEAGKRPRRVHGPFLSEQEVEAVVKDLSSRYQTSYIDIISEAESSSSSTGSLFLPSTEQLGEGSDAAMYKKAIAIVITEKKTSISYIQRKLRIGYNKAANFVEKMEEDGILSAPDATGKRNIIGTSD